MLALVSVAVKVAVVVAAVVAVVVVAMEGLMLLSVVVWREEMGVEALAGVVAAAAVVAQDLVVVMVWGKGSLSCGGKSLAEISEICAISGICAIS